MSEIAEPIQDIAHLGHVELLTPKPAESLRFFTEILGMECVHADGPSVWLRGCGDHAVSSLKLTEAAKPGVGHVAWRTVSPQALERRAAVIAATGLGLGWSNGDFGHGRSYRFNDPDGHLMEVYFEEDRYEAPEHLRSTLKNLPMRYPSHGVGVRRSDHLALLCRDVAANRGFATDVLGLKLREQVRFDGGATEIGSWMSSNPTHHELAYVVDIKGVPGRLHHVALWVDDRADVLRAADLMRENGIAIETGPSKHNNSQAFYIYVYEPGGNRIEVYTSGFLVYAPDFEPVVWDEAARDGGVYWGAKLPDSFIEYATPPFDGPDVWDDLPVIDPR
jgi:catechol 2,3-dioxygenase